MVLFCLLILVMGAVVSGLRKKHPKKYGSAEGLYVYEDFRGESREDLRGFRP